jgi:hypothetical protein
MAHSTLAPEDDESDLLLTYNYGLPLGKNKNDLKPTTETRRFRFRFDSGMAVPGTIAPWPALDRTLEIKADDIDILDDGREQASER